MWALLWFREVTEIPKPGQSDHCVTLGGCYHFAPQVPVCEMRLDQSVAIAIFRSNTVRL